MSTIPEMSPVRVYREFKTETAARNYRHWHGTGGWIFVDDADRYAVLFPPDMAPTEILTHPMAHGRAGRLLGAA